MPMAHKIRPQRSKSPRRGFESSSYLLLRDMFLSGFPRPYIPVVTSGEIKKFNSTITGYDGTAFCSDDVVIVILYGSPGLQIVWYSAASASMINLPHQNCLAVMGKS